MRVVIIGGGAGAKLTYNALWESGYTDIAFFDCYVKEWRKIIPLMFRNLSAALTWSDGTYFVATGGDILREVRTNEIKMMCWKPPITVIHPHTAVSQFAKIGSGVLICDSASVGPDAVIGDGVIVNEAAVVAHDCMLMDYSHITGNAIIGGYVTLGKYAFIGLGANILPHVIIGEGAMVAAGATVIKDVAPYTMVAGVPAVYKKDWKPE